MYAMYIFMCIFPALTTYPLIKKKKEKMSKHGIKIIVYAVNFCFLFYVFLKQKNQYMWKLIRAWSCIKTNCGGYIMTMGILEILHCPKYCLAFN